VHFANEINITRDEFLLHARGASVIIASTVDILDESVVKAAGTCMNSVSNVNRN